MKKNHDLVVFENGRISLKELASGETMHSRIGPWEEANSIYIEQSRLFSRLLPHENDVTRPLVVFDVGLGIAGNALAAVHCCYRALEVAGRVGGVGGEVGAGGAGSTGKRPRPLHLVSFESDLSGLALALEQAGDFPFFAGHETALRAILKEGKWRSEEGGISWEIREGEFARWVSEGFTNCPAPEVIFYDFYSPKSQPQLWTVEYFAALREASTPDCVLVTYSVSTPIRVALLLAGFFVGKGKSTAAKLETTVAARRLEDLENPLDREWLEKLRRSDRCLPHGFAESTRAEVLSRVAGLGQFARYLWLGELRSL